MIFFTSVAKQPQPPRRVLASRSRPHATSAAAAAYENRRGAEFFRLFSPADACSPLFKRALTARKGGPGLAHGFFVSKSARCKYQGAVSGYAGRAAASASNIAKRCTSQRPNAEHSTLSTHISRRPCSTRCRHALVFALFRPQRPSCRICTRATRAIPCKVVTGAVKSPSGYPALLIRHYCGYFVL